MPNIKNIMNINGFTTWFAKVGITQKWYSINMTCSKKKVFSSCKEKLSCLAIEYFPLAKTYLSCAENFCQKYALHVKNYFYFTTTISPCCKDCLLIGQEQACSRINRLAVQLVRWVSPCRKWPRIHTIMAAGSPPVITSICETLFETKQEE